MNKLKLKEKNTNFSDTYFNVAIISSEKALGQQSNTSCDAKFRIVLLTQQVLEQLSNPISSEMRPSVGMGGQEGGSRRDRMQ